jgi:hypothetical protein
MFVIETNIVSVQLNVRNVFTFQQHITDMENIKNDPP